MLASFENRHTHAPHVIMLHPMLPRSIGIFRKGEDGVYRVILVLLESLDGLGPRHARLGVKMVASENHTRESANDDNTRTHARTHACTHTSADAKRGETFSSNLQKQQKRAAPGMHQIKDKRVYSLFE
jgi:hypothetical protein